MFSNVMSQEKLTRVLENKEMDFLAGIGGARRWAVAGVVTFVLVLS
jgi:hypothetical protein